MQVMTSSRAPLGPRTSVHTRPLGVQPQPLDPVREGGPVELIAADVEHGADVGEVLRGAAFPEELQLAQDHVFRGGDPNAAARQLEFSPAGQRPVIQRIRAGRIQVRLVAAVLVDEIELAVAFRAASAWMVATGGT